MAFNVIFYTVSKAHNSTGLPAGTGSSYSCVAKDPLSIMSPTIVLRMAGGAAGNPVSWNYAYISAFGRYYWISDWTNVGPNWEASMQVDVLASFRSAIGSSTIFVTRSAYSFNGFIPDGAYPITNRERNVKLSLPNLFYNNIGLGTGFYAIGIASAASVNYYLLYPSQLSSLMQYLFSNAYYDAALNALGIANLYPEAKIAVDPMQYIISCLYIPAPLAAPNTAFAFHWYSSGTGGAVTVGLVTTPVTGAPVSSTNSTDSTYLDIDFETQIGADFWHPQASERGDFLNSEPFSRYTLNIPPFGPVELPAIEFATASNLRIKYTIDFKTGGGVIDIIKDHGLTSEGIIAHMCGSFGVEMPLSRIMTRGRNFYNEVGGILGGVGALASGIVSGNPGAIASGLGAVFGSGIRETVEANKPYATIYAGAGDASQLVGDPYIMATQRYVSDDSYATMGRPLMSRRQISAIPGYLQGDPSGLAISGATADELSRIRAFISEGMYYA